MDQNPLEPSKRIRTNLSWRQLVWWSESGLRRLGIDKINLLCAAGLPGADSMDIDLCCAKIDEWAEVVKRYTTQMLHIYERQPERFGHSRGYFKALSLITALQQQCGVRYNAAKRDLRVPFEVADSFIFGIIQGNGGSCASLPVLYCAVGHRLRYPMFLVHTKGAEAGHSYAQWDDGEVRFNIEATGDGMATPTDDHYRSGRFALTPDIEMKGCFLRPNSMRHCLARFLADRAQFCMEVKAYNHAVHAMGWAAALHTENHFYLNTAKTYHNEWLRELNHRKPPGFPKVFITSIEKRRFATLPLEFELEVCGIETMHCLLNDRRHDRDFWEPLRRGQKPSALPVEVESRVDKDGGKNIRFLFERNTMRGPGECSNV